MTRFNVQEFGGRPSGKKTQMRLEGEGFAIWCEGVKMAYALSENALSDWALYVGGALEVAYEYDLRAVEDRKDGRR